MNKEFTPWKLVQELEKVSSRLDKEALIAEALLQDKEEYLIAGLNLALTSTITFGVKQIPVKEFESSEKEYSPRAFFDKTQDLITREVSGHDAKHLIFDLMSGYSCEMWNNWYRRILMKDLRCGADVKTFNKVLKSLNQPGIPVFECQLAHDSTKHEDKMVGRKLASPKLDGIRLLSVIYPNGEVTQFSRSGKEMHNFETIREQLSLLAPFLNEPVVLDGEVMSSSFQDLMKQAYRKEDVQTTDARLFLFDFIPLSSFLSGKYEVSQEGRGTRLEVLLGNVSLANVKCFGETELDLDTAEGRELFKKINKLAIDCGYEGLMLKDPEAPYECKRSTSWLKLKPFIEVSLTIEGFEEGEGKNAGSLGAFHCRGIEDGKEIVVNVGGGFSEKQREEFWNNREELVGRIVEVRADAITKNQEVKNETYSLRFPRFLRFRGFEEGEKL